MAKVTLTRISSMVNAPTTINGILTEIESAFDNTLSRGGDMPNAMQADLDMNSRRILNLPAPVGATEPVRKGDIGLDALEQAIADAQADADAAAASAVDAAASANAAASSAANAAASAVDAAASFADASERAAREVSDYLAAHPIPATGSVSLVDFFDAAYAEGVAIDATTDSTQLAVKVKDVGAPANNYTGSLRGFLASTVFPDPKLCRQADGSWAYTPHNDFTYSNDFSDASWLKVDTVAVTPGQPGPTGANDGYLLAKGTTGTEASIRKVVTGTLDAHRTLAVKAKAGTSSWICLEFTDGATRRAWFNLGTGAVGTVEAGNTAEISAVDDDGSPLEAGWYLCRVHRKLALAGTTYKIYQVDADNVVTCTNSRNVLLAHAQCHRGVRRLAYVPTVAAVVRDAPYDWTYGERALLIEETGVTYNGVYSNDLTNAAWTKTDTSAALNAIGPDGEPCSTLTATGDAGTCLQAIVSAATRQSFAPAVRRKTGTGAVYVTIDNGVNWIDVTTLIGPAGGKYARVSALGSATNPTFGFKLAASGDAIEIAWANCGSNSFSTFVSSPLPTYGAARGRAADVFRIPFTAIPNDAEMSIFADVHTTTYANSLDNSIGFLGATNNIYLKPGVGNVVGFASNPSIGGAQSVYTFALGDRLQLGLSMKDAAHVLAVNGVPPAFQPLLDSTLTLTNARVGGVSPLWLRRLVIVPQAVSYDNMRTWFLDQLATTAHTDILANAMVKHFGENNAHQVRSPTIHKLWETDAKVGLIAFCGQRSATSAYHGEAPSRLIQRRFEFDKTTHALTPTESARVLVQQAGWATGTGHIQSMTPHKIRRGLHKGRLLLLWCQNDNPTFSPDNRNVWRMYSDDNGETWSTPTLTLDQSTLAAGSAFAIVGENGTSVQLPADHPTRPNRIIFPIHRTGTGIYALWTDDGGDTWEHTADANIVPYYPMFPDTSVSTSEAALQMWPDGTLVFVMRDDQAGGGGYPRSWAKSTDAGVTLVWQGVLTDINSINCNSSLCQYDVDGQYGVNGKLLLGGPTQLSTPNRHDFKIYKTSNATLTFDTTDVYTPFTEIRHVGYTCLVHLYDNVFALAWEANAIDAGFNGSVSVQVMVFRYPH